MLIKTSKWKFDTLLFLLMVSLCINSNVHNHLVTMDVLLQAIHQLQPLKPKPKLKLLCKKYSVLVFFVFFITQCIAVNFVQIFFLKVKKQFSLINCYS